MKKYANKFLESKCQCRKWYFFTQDVRFFYIIFHLGYFIPFKKKIISFLLVWHCWYQLFPTREGIRCWSRKSISTDGFISQIQPKSGLQKQSTWIQSGIPTKLKKWPKKKVSSDWLNKNKLKSTLHSRIALNVLEKKILLKKILLKL